jgi:hypothetical protein
MTLLNTTGVAGCILAATHIVACFPVYAGIAAGQASTIRWRYFYFISGLLTYGCWLVYATIAGNNLLGFAQALGILKYAIGLFQIAINKAP